MAVFLLSLVGIPPFVGFMGKLYVFAAIIEKGPAYWWYAVAAAVNATIAAYYYFRVLKTMAIDPGNEEKPALHLATLDTAWVSALVAANLLPLFFWGVIEGWARSSLVLYAGR
jgi:NADH-quinone oxidoreductase subunit N